MDELECARLYRRLDEDPTNLLVIDRLIEVETERGDTSRVIQRLWIAADRFERRSDGRGALECLERLGRLDPGETRNLASLAMVCGRLCIPEKLRPYLAQAASVVQQRGTHSLVSWIAAICRLPGDSPELIREISNPITSQSERDIRAAQRNGEMFQKLGDHKSAAQWFASVAEQYARDGFFLKAIALFKQVSRLDPLPNTDLRLGEMHA